MSLAKLDTYDYQLSPGVVQIRVDSTRDPIIADILSEIERFNGRVYVEGFYYIMAGYEIITQRHPGAPVYLNIYVTSAE